MNVTSSHSVLLPCPCPCAWQGWDWAGFKVHSNPNLSGIQCSGDPGEITVLDGFAPRFSLQKDFGIFTELPHEIDPQFLPAAAVEFCGSSAARPVIPRYAWNCYALNAGSHINGFVQAITTCSCTKVYWSVGVCDVHVTFPSEWWHGPQPCQQGEGMLPLDGAGACVRCAHSGSEPLRHFCAFSR